LQVEDVYGTLLSLRRSACISPIQAIGNLFRISLIVGDFMTTLREYRVNLGWSIYKLAEQAGISRPAAANAENGQPIKAGTAKAIADALSRAYGQTIRPTDIEGLNIL